MLRKTRQTGKKVTASKTLRSFCRKMLQQYRNILQQTGGREKIPSGELTLYLIRCTALRILLEKGLLDTALLSGEKMTELLKKSCQSDPYKYTSAVLKNLFFPVCFRNGASWLHGEEMFTPEGKKGFLKLLEKIPPEVKTLLLFRNPAGTDGKTFFPSDEYFFSVQKILDSFVPCLMRSAYAGSFPGRLLETLLAEESVRDEKLSRRKKTGSFYTPPEVVSYMVRESVTSYLTAFAENRQWSIRQESIRLLTGKEFTSFPEELIPYRNHILEALKQCRLLDPACGSGAFLLGAYIVFMELWDRLELPESGSLSGFRKKNLQLQRADHVLKQCLFGMDIQILPLQTVQICFLAAHGVILPEDHLTCCNALLREEEHTAHTFDIVLGNPPYVPVTGIPEEERLLYKKRFAFAAGRFNLFTLFLERSSYYLKAGAVFFFLVPDRVLLNTQYADLRQYLFEQMDPCVCVTFEKGIFPDATVDVVIFGCRNRGRALHDQKPIRCKKGAALSDLDTMPFELLEPGQISQCRFHEEESTSVWNRIREKSVPLGSIARIRDGIIQGAVGRELFLKGASGVPHAEKLLFGKNVFPYRISFENDYVNYDIPAMKKLESFRMSERSSGLRMRSEAVFRCRKILSRQTADRIIASMDEKGCYFYANTLHGTVVTDPQYDPYFVLGVMNSSIGTFLYRSQSMEKGKTFAQIKIALLRTLPIPVMNKTFQQQIARLVKKIMSLRSNKVPQENEADRLCHQIDEILLDFYGLTEDERVLIQNS